MSPQKQQSQMQSGPLTSYQQWRTFMIGLSLLVALTVIVFMRRGVGWRVLTLGSLYGMAAVLYILQGIGNYHVSIPLVGVVGAHHQTVSLKIFGLVFLAVGLWQRRVAWKELVRGGTSDTTYSLGESHFEFLPVKKSILYRVIDPAITFLMGLCLHRLGFIGLSLWFIFASVCWRLLEQHRYERQLDEHLDGRDRLIEAEVLAMAAEHWQRGAMDTKTGGPHPDAIATGVDSILEAEIARRKKKAAKGGASEDARS